MDFDTKSRKIGVYITDIEGISVRGTTLYGFDKEHSRQKTLRKPKEQIKLFLSKSRVKFRKAFDGIKTVDSQLSGRFNDNIIIIRAF